MKKQTIIVQLIEYTLKYLIIEIIFQGLYIDKTELNVCKFHKIKSPSVLLNLFTKKTVEKNYLVFLDEFYIYFLKDIEVSKDDKNIRKIGNKYNLKLLQNANVDVINKNKFQTLENGKIHIFLEFAKDFISEDTIEKNLFFELKQAEKFVGILNTYLKRLGIAFTEEDNQNTQNSEKNLYEENKLIEEFKEDNKQPRGNLIDEN